MSKLSCWMGAELVSCRLRLRPCSCCSHYEQLYGEALPAEEGRPAGRTKQETLQQQIQQLIAKKPSGGGTSARGPSGGARPTNSGGKSGTRAPGRMVNPFTTMPGMKGSQAWIGSGRPAPAAAVDSGGHLADQDMPLSGFKRPTVPLLQLPGAPQAPTSQHHHQQQQQQEDAQAGGRLWRPQEAVRGVRETPRQGGPSHSGMPGSPGRSCLTSRGGSGVSSHLGAAAPILMRQIELKAALRPPSAEPPHKSPWRPPGKAVACRLIALSAPNRAGKASCDPPVSTIPVPRCKPPLQSGLNKCAPCAGCGC